MDLPNLLLEISKKASLLKVIREDPLVERMNEIFKEDIDPVLTELFKHKDIHITKRANASSIQEYLLNQESVSNNFLELPINFLVAISNLTKDPLISPVSRLALYRGIIRLINFGKLINPNYLEKPRPVKRIDMSVKLRQSAVTAEALLDPTEDDFI